MTDLDWTPDGLAARRQKLMDAGLTLQQTLAIDALILEYLGRMPTLPEAEAFLDGMEGKDSDDAELIDRLIHRAERAERELAGARAEIERVKAGSRSYHERAEQAERERDEARAETGQIIKTGIRDLDNRAEKAERALASLRTRMEEARNALLCGSIVLALVLLSSGEATEAHSQLDTGVNEPR